MRMCPWRVGGISGATKTTDGRMEEMALGIPATRLEMGVSLRDMLGRSTGPEAMAMKVWKT